MFIRFTIFRIFLFHSRMKQCCSLIRVFTIIVCDAHGVQHFHQQQSWDAIDSWFCECWLLILLKLNPMSYLWSVQYQICDTVYNFIIKYGGFTVCCGSMYIQFDSSRLSDNNKFKSSRVTSHGPVSSTTTLYCLPVVLFVVLQAHFHMLSYIKFIYNIPNNIFHLSISLFAKYPDNQAVIL